MEILWGLRKKSGVRSEGAQDQGVQVDVDCGDGDRQEGLGLGVVFDFAVKYHTPYAFAGRHLKSIN